MAGTSVTERSAAKAMENVLVNASGLKSRPSVPSSVNTGRNATVITRSEKKIGRPTSTSAAVTTSWRGVGRPADSQSSSRLCTFSTTMIAASTMAPMAMAIPPRLMMLAPRRRAAIGTKASSTAMGNIKMGTSVERTCSRKTRMTSATTTISSSSVWRRVSMLARIRVERS